MTPTERQQVIHALELSDTRLAIVAAALAIMRRPVEPVAWIDADGDVYSKKPPDGWCPPHTPLYKD